jgi:hypothetical protein
VDKGLRLLQLLVLGMVFIGFLLFYIFIPKEAYPGEFVSMVNPLHKLTTDENVLVPDRDLYLVDIREMPGDKNTVMYLYAEKGFCYIDTDKNEEVYPYMEILHRGYLIKLAFINKDLKIEAWGNDAAFGGPDINHLFREDLSIFKERNIIKKAR